MKKLTIGLTMAMTLMTSTSTFAATGTERGGGNLLESAFSKAIRQVEGELSNLGKRASAKLKFSLDQYADASSGITVECASLPEDIDYLKTKKRLAFVKNPGQDGDKTIFLNCYNQSSSELVLTEDWKDVLEGITNKKSLSTNAKVLVTHEVFRAGGLEIKEGDYRLSSSIKLAQIEQDKVLREQMVELMTYKNKKCYVRVEAATRCGSPGDYQNGDFTNIEIYSIRGFTKNDVQIFGSCDMSDDRVGVEAQKTNLINLQIEHRLTGRTIQALKNNNCLDGR